MIEINSISLLEINLALIYNIIVCLLIILGLHTKRLYQMLLAEHQFIYKISSPFFCMKEAGIGGDHGREGMDCTDATMEGVRFSDQSQLSIAPACAELKDKGICLFPLSVLLHYHGRTN